MQALVWLAASDVRLVLVVALVFAGAIALRLLGTSHWGIDTATVQVLASVVLIGAFLGVIVVTDGPRTYRKSGAKVRVVAGVIAGAGVAIICSLPFEAVALGALLGAVLGYIGMRWAQHMQL